MRVESSSAQRRRGADRELDRLGALGADRHPVLEADVVGDRVVEVVAADPQRAGDDDAAERDDRDLAGAAADVDDHPPHRLGDRQPGADGGGERLLDQVHLARARGQRRLLDRAALDVGDPRGRAHDQPRAAEAAESTLSTNWRSIASVTSKSAITPWRSGRSAEIVAGVRPIISCASAPTACTSPVRWSIATTDGSDSTIPRPRT